MNAATESHMHETRRSPGTGLPLVEELIPCPDVAEALRAFSGERGVLVLESALRRDEVGRYSFLAADPYEFFTIDKAAFGSEPFARIRDSLRECESATLAGLPPFQGGAAGLLSYELGHAWEKVSSAGCDEFELPALAVGLYDWVIAWDHAAGRAWIISQGFPEADPARRTDRAAARLHSVREKLRDAAERPRSKTPPLTKGVSGGVERGGSIVPPPAPPYLGGERVGGQSVPVQRLAPQYAAPGPPGLTSDFSRDGYLRAVERVIEYIHAGDIFQANLSQRLLAPLRDSPIELYERLRRCNPAPFAGYFAHDDWAVVSASPERFVSVRGGEVETRPIKGTRRRQPRPEADLYTRDELRESRKDQAENVMIVDLLRNDLSRVCVPGTIRVPRLCRVETYETVQHLVSEIRGRLAAGRDAWDLLRAAFPGGSITGAPKVRAMEIIAELEPTARGPYCGSLFYVGYDGAADSSILIRTFACRRGWIQCPVGGGIVAQSDPVAEYEETLDKAAGMLRALETMSR